MLLRSVRIASGVLLAWGVLATALTLSSVASAQGPGGASTAAPGPAPGPNPHGAAPAGDDDDDDPHAGGAGSAPHGHAAGGAENNGMFQPPQDGAMDDPTYPVGTLIVHILDPSGKPIPNAPVTLGILFNSVAKGESRKRLFANTDDKGVARFDHMETGSSVAYRPMVINDGATFSVMPFRMPEKTGMSAVLHVYPVIESLEGALVVSQSVLYAEVKDDRIQIQQAVKIYNFGKTAWVPKDVIIPLPETFTAFTTQQGMSDVGADAVPKKGVKIHGTFSPGQHMIEFRWQLPYAGEAEVRFDVGMAPHTAASRVIAPASKEMKLEVPGFPPPQENSDGMGQRALITEKQLRREDAPLKTVTVVIKGLPTEGPGKIIATILSASGLLLGLVLGTKKPDKHDRKKERARLLDELEDLERSHEAGDIGPKTYERARRELIDAVARTFADDAAMKSPPPARVRARA